MTRFVAAFGNLQLMRLGLWAAILLASSISSSLTAQAGSFDQARRLMDLMNVPATVEAILVDAVQEARDDLVRRGLPRATVNRVTNAMRHEMGTSMPSLIDEVAMIYADEFTDEELTDLIAFYESPTGRKFAQSRQEIARKQTRAMEGWLKSVADRTKAKLSSAAVS